MVYRGLPCCQRAGAILAFELVAGEDVYAGQWRRPLADFDVAEEPDHGRSLDGEGNGVDLVVVFLDNFDFTHEQQGHGSLPRDDAEWFKTGV